MKLLWLDYLVYSLDNCVMKLCIKTGDSNTNCIQPMALFVSATGQPVTTIKQTRLEIVYV